MRNQLGDCTWRKAVDLQRRRPSARAAAQLVVLAVLHQWQNVGLDAYLPIVDDKPQADRVEVAAPQTEVLRSEPAVFVFFVFRDPVDIALDQRRGESERSQSIGRR